MSERAVYENVPERNNERMAKYKRGTVTDL